MADEKAPVRRRRLGAQGMTFRLRRIFIKLREGFTYDEIAAEEGVSPARVRQIVSEELKQRTVDSGTEHAKLQLERLAPALQLGAAAIAAGDVSAISPYLRAIDRLDRYQTVAGVNERYDDEARQKLLDKINRVVENLRAKEAEAKEALGTLGPEGAAGGAEGAGVALELTGEEDGSEPPAREVHPGAGFFYANWP
jgi:predicted transcriptional regulator